MRWTNKNTLYLSRKKKVKVVENPFSSFFSVSLSLSMSVYMYYTREQAKRERRKRKPRLRLSLNPKKIDICEKPQELKFSLHAVTQNSLSHKNNNRVQRCSSTTNPRNIYCWPIEGKILIFVGLSLSSLRYMFASFCL